MISAWQSSQKQLRVFSVWVPYLGSTSTVGFSGNLLFLSINYFPTSSAPIIVIFKVCPFCHQANIYIYVERESVCQFNSLHEILCLSVWLFSKRAGLGPCESLQRWQVCCTEYSISSLLWQWPAQATSGLHSVKGKA